GKSGINTLDSYYLIFNMTFVMVTSYVQSCLIAEEKEKNTLRALMLSPANVQEILIGKSLFTFVTTALTMFLCMILIDYKPANLFIIGIAMVISTLFYIAIGTFVGLFCQVRYGSIGLFFPFNRHIFTRKLYSLYFSVITYFKSSSLFTLSSVDYYCD